MPQGTTVKEIKEYLSNECDCGGVKEVTFLSKNDAVTKVFVTGECSQDLSLLNYQLPHLLTNYSKTSVHNVPINNSLCIIVSELMCETEPSEI